MDKNEYFAKLHEAISALAGEPCLGIGQYQLRGNTMSAPFPLLGTIRKMQAKKRSGGLRFSPLMLASATAGSIRLDELKLKGFNRHPMPGRNIGRWDRSACRVEVGEGLATSQVTIHTPTGHPVELEVMAWGGESAELNGGVVRAVFAQA